MSSSNELTERFFVFALKVIQSLKYFKKTPEAYVIRKQLAKSATSVGANYEEAQSAVSRADFKHKISICLKEIRETHYWLRLCRAALLHTDNAVMDILLAEANELKLILGAISVKLEK